MQMNQTADGMKITNFGIGPNIKYNYATLLVNK